MQKKTLRTYFTFKKSLTMFGRVINILACNERQTHVPYRDSILTKLLKESLGGNSKTAMIATCSENGQLDHTVSTLRFAESVANIVNHVEANKIDIQANQMNFEQQALLQEKIIALENQLNTRDLVLQHQNSLPSLILLTQDPSFSKLVVNLLPVERLNGVATKFKVYEDGILVKLKLIEGVITVNGLDLKPGESMQLSHGDRIVFEERFFYALNLPKSGGKISDLVDYSALTIKKLNDFF